VVGHDLHEKQRCNIEKFDFEEAKQRRIETARNLIKLLFYKRNDMVLKASELKEFEKNRDIDAEILRGMEQILSGVATVEHVIQIPDVVAARQKTGLSQSTFAELLGISKRTLQEWEQTRKTPSKAAQSLIKIAMKHPEILRELQTS